jgi:hypothetical protein
MKAQIRTATRKEFPGICRPKVCVIEDKLVYRFEPWSGRVIDIETKEVFAPQKENGTPIYQFPQGRRFSVKEESGRWVFNGISMEERWPTPYRREFISGSYVIDVKPEDDTLSFSFDSRPEVDHALVAFYAGIHIAGD